MQLSSKVIQKIQVLAWFAYEKIGVRDIRKQIDMTIKFARSQPPVEIILDGNTAKAIAVDIASVFSLEEDYRQIEENGQTITATHCQVLSIVIMGDDVRLCKATFDAVPGGALQKERYINARYWSTDAEQLTETYIC